jgi:hypothetical protein
MRYSTNTASQSETSDTPSPFYPEVKEVEPNRYIGKKFGDLIDDIVGEHARNGGFDNLQGKGRPLDLEDTLYEDYYVYKKMKNANVILPG